MTGRREAVSTQEQYPWKAVARTLLALVIGLAGSWAVIVQAAGLDQSWEWVGASLAVAAAITRLMAVPLINGWLQLVGLGSTPKTPADPTLTDWHDAQDNRGKLGGIAVLAVLALILVTALPASAASITYPYTAHVQGVGWQKTVGDGATAGTTGKSLRLEAVRFVFPGQQARGHVQDIGWQAWQASDSTQVGTVGKSKRLEAIQVRSTIPGVTIECQAHVQGIGWMPRVGDGQVCGTTGKGLRLEAVRLWLVQQ